VSPDERTLHEVIAAARRRAALMAAAEAAAWGAAAAAISPAGGAVVALALAVWRSRMATRSAVVRALERASPDARNLLITADELASGSLSNVKPDVRDRVFADAAARARQIDPRRAFAIAPCFRAMVLAAIVWIVVAMRGPFGPMTRVPLLGSLTLPSSTAASGGIRVAMSIQPPAYTGLAETKLVDPVQIQAIEGSTLSISVESAATITVEHDGVSTAIAHGPDGRFTSRALLTKTGYLLITAGETGPPEGGPHGGARPAAGPLADARRLIPIIVSPDALPVVTLPAPGRDLRYANGNPTIAFDAHATDDFGLKSLALRYTKVSGAGEQFDFQEGELPLQVTQANGRDWHGRVSRPLADLNLKDGDMLVYRAVASDARPGDGSASSDAFLIEISKLGAAAGDAFTLPEEETKYALSQQMLIMKTERLNQQRASMAAGDLSEAALNLAVEQRMIRAEFVFMLGGEIEDEDVEAAQSNELQEGRLQNRGQHDLRAATVAMSQAEKLLTGANTAEALKAERAAVAALQRAFSKDRYILRALAARSQLDQTRRLTGNLSQAADWRRAVPEPPANRRLAQLEDLLRGLAVLTAVLDASDWRPRALVLAEQALRIDPASASLRQIATDLQRAADAIAAGRSSALASAANAAAVEARRAHAGGTLATPAVAPGLSGAFTEVLHR
jgi:hypothetical protein